MPLANLKIPLTTDHRQLTTDVEDVHGLSFLKFGRRGVGQSLKDERHKGDAVGGSKECRTNSEQLPLRIRRDDVPIANSGERDYLKVELINERPAMSNRWLRRVGKKIVFDSENCQNATNKNGPNQEGNPDEKRLSSRVPQEIEDGTNR